MNTTNNTEHDLNTTYNRQDLSESIGERLVALKDAFMDQCKKETGFSSQDVSKGLKKWPSSKVISSIPEVDVYVELLAEEGDLENEVLIGGLILLERYLRHLEDLCPIHFHKLVAVSIYVAQKVILDTEMWALSDFGAIAGLSPKNLAKLEIELLNDLDYKVHLGEKEFSLYRDFLQGYE